MTADFMLCVLFVENNNIESVARGNLRGSACLCPTGSFVAPRVFSHDEVLFLMMTY